MFKDTALFSKLATLYGYTRHFIPKSYAVFTTSIQAALCLAILYSATLFSATLYSIYSAALHSTLIQLYFIH